MQDMETYGFAGCEVNRSRYEHYLKLLKGYGIKDEFMVAGEEMTGLSGMLSELPCQSGDMLLIPSLDCLGSSYKEILQNWKNLIYDKHLEVKVLNLPALDTRLYHDISERVRLLDLVNQLLGFASLREEEQQLKRRITTLVSVKQAEKKAGRKPLSYPANWDHIYDQWQSGSLTAKQAMVQSNLKYASFYNLVKRYEQENQIVRRRIHGKQVSDLLDQ